MVEIVRALYNNNLVILRGDLDLAYKLRKDENIRESVIRKFYELIGGDPGKFVYLGNIVKRWTKNEIIRLYSQWKAKTGVFLIYFNS